MIRFITLFLICLSLQACQFFQVEKVSSETLFEEEIQTINWKDVDAYPLFSSCEESLDKERQKECFINTLNAAIYQKISNERFTTSQQLFDTVYINFKIDNIGKLSVLQIQIDSLVSREFPDFETQITEALNVLEISTPAYKRGIPVTTQFTLPIIVRTND